MMPKNKDSLEREYQRCLCKKAFVQIPKEKYVYYVKEDYSDWKGIFFEKYFDVIGR